MQFLSFLQVLLYSVTEPLLLVLEGFRVSSSFQASPGFSQKSQGETHSAPSQLYQ